MAPAWRIITGHGGQGPDLALSGSPNLDSTWREREKKACPHWPHQAPPSSSCPSRPFELPASQPARQSASQPGSSQARFLQGVGRPHLLPRPGRAWSPAWSTKTVGPGWFVVGNGRPTRIQIEVRPWAHHHPATLPTLLVMSSSQHIQEVSRRGRWSHLANERSISTSKGPPPAPAKARLDAMLLLRPCLFPSPPPCSHTFSLTTNC